jgi:hypothetical protein
VSFLLEASSGLLWPFGGLFGVILDEAMRVIERVEIRLEWVQNKCSLALYHCEIHSNWDSAAEFRSNYASELTEAGLVDIAQAFAVIERLRPVYNVLHGCDATMGWLSMEEREAAAGVEFTEEEMDKLSKEDQRRIDEEDYPVDYQRLLEEAKRANLLTPPEGGGGGRPRGREQACVTKTTVRTNSSEHEFR